MSKDQNQTDQPDAGSRGAAGSGKCAHKWITPPECPQCIEHERDETAERLIDAEEILDDLASGYWSAVLNDADLPVSELMGDRVMNYWRKWSDAPNTQICATDGMPTKSK